MRAPTGAEDDQAREQLAAALTEARALLFWPSEASSPERDAEQEPPLPGYWPGVADRKQVGPIGDGTPHARMHWFWRRMERHEQLICELVPEYSPLTSRMCFEEAIALAFERLLEADASSEETQDDRSGGMSK